jgi:hypothetical protein
MIGACAVIMLYDAQTSLRLAATSRIVLLTHITTFSLGDAYVFHQEACGCSHFPRSRRA